MALIDGAAMVTLVTLPLAFTVSGALVIAGWHERRVVLQRQGQRATVGRFELGRTPFEAGTLDVAAEAREVLHPSEGPRRSFLPHWTSRCSRDWRCGPTGAPSARSSRTC